MSFLEISPESDFPIENLPFGIFSSEDNPKPRPCVAIGNYVLDIQKAIETKYLFNTKSSEYLAEFFNESTLNKFIDQTPEIWHEVRINLQNVLSVKNLSAKDSFFSLKLLHKQENVKLYLPIQIGDYTDFYSSKEHARNVGEMFRGKENPLLLNWLHLPVAYHGRASSIVISGTDIYRPNGQIKEDNQTKPEFGPCKKLDFELEMAFIIGNKGNKLGDPINIKEADKKIFGLVIMNDWSARDIQKWEYVPLGPFLSKNFSTTISPWIVTLEALQAFKTKNVVQDPVPLPYLQHEDDFNFDINLEVYLNPKCSGNETLISKSNFKYLYWTIKQQLVHHSVTGCNLRTGDLLGSGTISGPTPDSLGSLLELSWNNTRPLKLKNGEQRSFLEDYDKVIISGFCKNEHYRIGFGKCVGKILPAKSI